MHKRVLLLCLIALIYYYLGAQPRLYVVGETSNDIFYLLKKNGIGAVPIKTIDKGFIDTISDNSSIIFLADRYPGYKAAISKETYEIIRKRPSVRLYVEFPEVFPDRSYAPQTTYHGELERGVVNSCFFGDSLPRMSLLGINDCYVIPIVHDNPIMVYANVAGFDKAEFGLDNTKTYPLLVEDANILISTTALSNFVQGRYSPNHSWRIVWQGIIRWLLNNYDLTLTSWVHDPSPSFLPNDVIDKKDKLNSIKKGADWFFYSGLLLHPSWKDLWLKYQGNGSEPFGPPLDKDMPVGDGSMGILEGHASKIQQDGSQKYRYWIRTDVQGEVAYALAAAGNILEDKEYSETSAKLIDYLFSESNAKLLTSDKTKGSYGLLGWSYTHPEVIYGDDNARAIIGVIGASTYLKKKKWNRLIVENILANFRTSSKYGFQGRWLNAKHISKNGWEHYLNSDAIRPQPHHESWMIACYIWLYDKTGYKPLLDKAVTALKIMMEAYPDKWKWTNGLQQERARMILPLAWLVKVDNNDEYKQWLVTVVDDLLEYQQPNGALMEIMGGDDSLASYGRIKSNASYGTTEAPLIFENGDPVADMLYTNNFALFSLNEAAKSIGSTRYQSAVESLSDFLTKVQIKSSIHRDLDGAWFRAFDFARWDYWASNADIGWGAWCTLSGWIQSWIIATKVLIEEDSSFWDKTRNIDIIQEFENSLWMLEQE